jgi:predicted PurR-regulated permease PerM
MSDSRLAKPSPDDIVDRAVDIAIRLGLIAAMLSLCYLVVRPFLVPIAWAMIIAVAVYPGYLRLLRWVRGRRKLAAVLFALLALVVLILPVAMLSGTLVEGGKALAEGLEQGSLRVPPAPEKLAEIPLIGEPAQALWNRASANLQEVLKLIEPQIKAFGSWALSLVASAGMALLHLLLAIGIAAVLLVKADDVARLTHALANRVAGRRGRGLAQLSEAVVRSVSRGILGVALIQSLLAGVGMLAAGVPGAGLWAVVALVLSTIQIGTVPVMVPALIYLFYTAGTTTVVLFLIWTIIVGSLDNILKPLLLGRGVKVPMPVVFVGAIGGFLAAGIIGLFLGAVVLVLGYELFLAWLQLEREGALATPKMMEDPAGADD